jgi:hypothetical protein
LVLLMMVCGLALFLPEEDADRRPEFFVDPVPSQEITYATPSASSTATRKKAKRKVQPKRTTERAVYYSNCTEARAAGAAPLRVGDPGYRKGLDRDGDGQACGED